MKGALILVSLAGVALAVEGGYWGAIGWGLFLASLVAIIVQRSVINKLKEELKFERGEREYLSQQVSELKKRVKEQQDQLLSASMERMELSREVERLAKELTTSRNHLVELAKSNEFMRTTLDNLVARIQTLEGRS